MLDHLGLNDEASKIRDGIHRTLAEAKVRTRDLGGFATTTQFTQAVIEHIK
jgi:isocitrate dehydrogenase (NAD+)